MSRERQSAKYRLYAERAKDVYQGCILHTSCGTLFGMNKRQSHTECTHLNTKAARAACRRSRLNDNTAIVVEKSFAFVLGARGKGYGNQVEMLTFYRISREYGIDPFDEDTAKRMAREKAEEAGLLDILGHDVRPEKEIK